MIDPHVHLRDWRQKDKETIHNGIVTAYKAGLDGIIEKPNTKPALTSRKNIELRLKRADKTLNNFYDADMHFFHGISAGITSDKEQIKEVVKAYDELERVVALKMFAGHSTGNMGLIDDDHSTGEEKQRLVYKTLSELNYRGVLEVHCEKESYMIPESWELLDPITHTYARPPEAEIESVKDQIIFAQEADYKGTLHICHISVPESLKYIENMRDNVDFNITTELTPHHALLYDKMMDSMGGLLLKMNPPLRPKHMQEYMLKALLDKRIDMICTDHAPHTLEDKLSDNPASGIPGLQFYPSFIQKLKDKKASEELIEDITHNNIIRIYGISPDTIPSTKRAGKQSSDFLKKLNESYEFNPFGIIEEFKNPSFNDLS